MASVCEDVRLSHRHVTLLPSPTWQHVKTLNVPTNGIARHSYVLAFDVCHSSGSAHSWLRPLRPFSVSTLPPCVCSWFPDQTSVLFLSFFLILLFFSFPSSLSPSLRIPFALLLRLLLLLCLLLLLLLSCQRSEGGQGSGGVHLQPAFSQWRITSYLDTTEACLCLEKMS